MITNNKISELIEVYRKFLNASWDLLDFGEIEQIGLEERERAETWLQANWEIIVEYQVCEVGQYLIHYGDGAENVNGSSRVLYPDAIPTHLVICKPINSDIENLHTGKKIEFQSFRFFQFVTEKSCGYFISKPPFEYVSGLDELENEIVVHHHNLHFEIVPINN